MNTTLNKFDRILGLSLVANLVIGYAGFIAALFAFFNANWTGVGICLGASALAFGLLANALMRR